MATPVLFLLLGLGAGAIYAVLALGLVLQFRSAGVINFAQGAIAMFIAYVYVELRDQGELVAPWAILPHSISLSNGSIGMWPAIVISVVYAAVLGAVLYALIFRRLRHAPPLAKVGASVGLMLAFQAIAVLNFGTSSRSTEPILPSKVVHVASVSVPSDRL